MPAAWKVFGQGLKLQLADMMGGKMDAAVVGLYIANYAPQLGDDELVYLAMEASWPGYAAQSVLSWSLPELDSGGRAVTYSNVLTWEVAGPTTQLAYGYFVMSATYEGLWAELFDAPITPTPGIPISRVARYNFRNA